MWWSGYSDKCSVLTFGSGGVRCNVKSGRGHFQTPGCGGCSGLHIHIHKPHALPRDQIYGLLKIIYTTERATIRVTRGKPPPPRSLDPPTGLPPHTKAHTATHTSHPHSTCRTQNYVYIVKHLKAKDHFTMNILYNVMWLLFQTM